MTDTKPDILPDGVARQIPRETFRDFAHKELLASPPWQEGRCFNPACCRPFNVRREWQIFCSAICERQSTAEMRRWGHRLAFPSLVHRMGKYEKADDDMRALNRAARRYITAVQSEWLAERQLMILRSGV